MFVEPNLDWSEDCYRNNLKEKVIYDTLGIPEQTWYAFLRKYPELKELKRRNRDVALAQVENAMFKRATGATIKKEVAMKVAEKVFNDEGKLIKYFPVKNSPLIQNDYKKFKFYVKPFYNQDPIKIKWTLLARDFKKEGELTIKNSPVITDRLKIEWVDSVDKMQETSLEVVELITEK